MNIQDWTLYYDNFGPLSCQAPCTMYSVLYDHGKIPDPFYGTNERELQYLAEKDCVFESVFSAPPALLTREHIELVFHGLDTICHIYLNGTLLGKVKNMHREYVYEVKPLLTAGENTLRLEFKSPRRYFAQQQHKHYLYMNDGDTLPGAAHLRKAMYQSGWDWGPTLPDMGIFRGVELKGWNVDRFDGVAVRQHHENGSVSVELDVTTKCHAGCEIYADFDGKRVLLKDGHGIIKVDNPKLWWARGYGDQPLYDLDVELVCGGEVIDRCHKQLGLRTLTVVNKTIESIRARYGVEVDFNTIPDDDPETYQMLSAGDTAGVFQLEGSGLRAVLKDLQPESLEDIIALVALYRPGPLGSGMVEDFIARKHGEQEITYLDPKLEPILNTTYGVILYQEQVMQIASSLCGFTLGEADMLRRAMGKKKPEIIAGYKTQFIEGAQKGGTSAEIAEKIFELIEYFAGYGFNKSHSAAYGLLAFQTGWLKCHYPKEFMAETLNSFIDRVDKMTFYISECRRLGIPVLPPDINASGVGFTATDEGIRFGLNAIKSVGQHPVDLICQARAEAPFTSFQDFCTRVEIGGTVGRRVLEALIKAGTFDSLGQGTRGLLAVLDECIAQAQQLQKNRNSNQMSLFDFVEAPSLNTVSVEIPDIGEFDKDERLRYEKEMLGIYVSGHPLDSFSEALQHIASCSISEINEQMDGVTLILCGIMTGIRMQTTKKGDLMAYASLGDREGDIDLLIFPRTLPQVRSQLEENNIVKVTGRASIQDDERKIFVESIEPLRHAAADPAKAPLRVFVKIAEGLPYDDERVLAFLTREPRGDVPVFLCYMPESRIVLLNETYWVNDDPALWSRLGESFGPENVNIQRRQPQ